jgi:hypothetical protein
MKSLAAIVAILAFAAPVLADRGVPPKKIGDDYGLHRRDRRANVPRADDTAAKVTIVTEAMVAKVAKVRRGEVEYCWERLPSTQRIAGTAVLRFAIEPDGSVAAVDFSGDAPGAAAACIADLAHRWTFPAMDAKSVVEYAIRLR